MFAEAVLDLGSEMRSKLKNQSAYLRNCMRFVPNLEEGLGTSRLRVDFTGEDTFVILRDDRICYCTGQWESDDSE